MSTNHCIAPYRSFSNINFRYIVLSFMPPTPESLMQCVHTATSLTFDKPVSGVNKTIYYCWHCWFSPRYIDFFQVFLVPPSFHRQVQAGNSCIRPSSTASPAAMIIEWRTEWILFRPFIGRRPNGFLGLSLNDGTILFRVILLDKTVSVG